MTPELVPFVPASSPSPTTVWLTDRSRYKLGTSRCPRARFLGYYWGPTGYGLTLRADSLPLATGLYVHQGVEAFGRLMLRTDRLPSLQETRDIVAAICQAYLQRVEVRGFRGVLAGEHTEETIVEQSVLISGLLWALRLKVLPWLHETYRLVSVEEERTHLLACTCGAGPLDLAEHTARGCQGVAIMLRNDLLAARRTGTTLAYFEVKTTGWESEAWAEQWEADPQLGLGTIDAQARYGAEVAEIYVVGLNKGRRARDWKDTEGRKKQQSALAYGYFRPGNPPLAPDDWKPAYEWVDEAGEVKRAPRTHKRTGVWELAKSDWPAWVAHKAEDDALTPEECWVRLLPPSVLDKVCFVLGPMNRQDAQIASLRRSMAGEEARWRETLWRLYDAGQQHGWASETYQATLDAEVPCSWACRPFGREHQCEFFQLCHREAGWEDPLAGGRYVPRRPHHQIELETAVARGLLPPEAAEREAEDEER